MISGLTGNALLRGTLGGGGGAQKTENYGLLTNALKYNLSQIADTTVYYETTGVDNTINVYVPVADSMYVMYPIIVDGGGFIRLNQISIGAIASGVYTESYKVTPNSNIEIAITAKKYGAAYADQWVPYHGTVTTTPVQRSIFVDGSLIADYAAHALRPCTKIIINGIYNCYNANEASENLLRLACDYTISINGFKVNSNILALQDTLINNYAFMLPVHRGWATSFIADTGATVDLTPSTGVAYDISGDDNVKSMLVYNNASADYAKTVMCAAFANANCLRVGASDRGRGGNSNLVVWAEQRNDPTINKIYVSTFYNHKMSAGESLGFSTVYYVGRQAFTDSDASAFIATAGITDSTQQSAIIGLVLALKTAKLWDALIAVYPFVGGTATAHKYNLKNPQNTDQAYRLGFSGTWSHSLTGATPNGTNGYASTYLNPVSVGLSLTSAHLSYYQRSISDTGSTRYKIGCATTAAPLNAFALGRASAGSKDIGLIGGSTSSEYTPTPAITTSLSGLAIVTSRGTRYAYYNNNGVDINSGVLQSGSFFNGNIAIGAINADGITAYANKEVAFASIGYGLTDSQCTALYKAVQAYQTALGRQV